jgi:hypothetical protein
VNKQTNDDRVITDYLLGALSADEAERFDAMSFTDDEFAGRLQAVENDLVDAYVRGDLRGLPLERFKSMYLSNPAGREKVQFAERFLKLADGTIAAENPPQTRLKTKRPFSKPFGWTIAAAAALLIVIGGLAVQDSRLRRQRDQAMAELQDQRGRRQTEQVEQQNQITELRNTIARLGAPAAAQEPAIAPFVLSPQTRGIGRIRSITVPAGTDFVTFQLELEADSPVYRASLKSLPGGDEVWSRAGLRAQSRDSSRVVVVSLRADLLNSGDYVLEISREAAGQPVEVVGNYVFHIFKR